MGAWSVFLYQLAFLCHGAARPTELRTVIHQVPLKADTLPVTVMVCASPGLIQTKLKQTCYSDAIYARGLAREYSTSGYNSIGWEGHLKNGTTMTNRTTVTVTDFAPFSLSIFLSNVGGSLGLWLGLGILQLVELPLNTLARLLPKNGQWY